ncbi:hypothetical protein PoB_007122100 [Plakobranchus ocellatus]|uniref:Uncharacterized protein n=1 Tax=Plakobranchus ocellatus TaxID=259542 RepID=A0AAV4DLG8_9GAST|nr:hypothetical protein PoB_007122100 [Plakobranchus ocellatus]
MNDDDDDGGGGGRGGGAGCSGGGGGGDGNDGGGRVFSVESTCGVHTTEPVSRGLAKTRTHIQEEEEEEVVVEEKKKEWKNFKEEDEQEEKEVNEEEEEKVVVVEEKKKERKNFKEEDEQEEKELAHNSRKFMRISFYNLIRRAVRKSRKLCHASAQRGEVSCVLTRIPRVRGTSVGHARPESGNSKQSTGLQKQNELARKVGKA